VEEAQHLKSAALTSDWIVWHMPLYKNGAIIPITENKIFALVFKRILKQQLL
jgi:hypothetical protein